MKLSELTTEQVTDVLCELTPFLANIASDEDLMEELRNAINVNKTTTRAEALAAGAEKLSKIIPILLKKRKWDLFGIVGAVNRKSAQEIAKQNILVTLKQARDVIKDKDLVDFFKSCVGSEGSE